MARRCCKMKALCWNLAVTCLCLLPTAVSGIISIRSFVSLIVSTGCCVVALGRVLFLHMHALVQQIDLNLSDVEFCDTLAYAVGQYAAAVVLFLSFHFNYLECFFFFLNEWS